MIPVKDIKEFGFKGFVSISKLTQEYTLLPNNPGVYYILLPDNFKIEFLESGSGGFFKSRNPNVIIETLKNEWVHNANILYIGKATSLKTRLKQYMQFGQGKAVGHWGGRHIWQIKNAQDLIVCWKPLTDESPEVLESAMIAKFKETYGKRPFANLKD